MPSNALITILTVVLSVLSVVLSGIFGVRTTRLAHKLEEDRTRRVEEESAIKAAERVYEPLAQSAAELQSRIFNMVETGWVPLMKRYESHGDYAIMSTASSSRTTSAGSRPAAKPCSARAVRVDETSQCKSSSTAY